MSTAKLCPKCGQNHGALGLHYDYENGILTRTLDSSRNQLIRKFGGAVGFMASVLDFHPEIHEIVAIDRATNLVRRVDRLTLERFAIRATLRPSDGPQIILPLSKWRTGGDRETTISGPKPAQPAVEPMAVSQLSLFVGL